MLIAIASKNRAKVKACHDAFEKLKSVFKDHFPQEISFVSVEADSSVSEMPLTLNELLEGARNRALFVYEQLQSNNKKADYIIGMEGGVFRTGAFSKKDDSVLLQNWVYTFNGKHGFYGCSAGLPLPEKVSDALFVGKKELAEVIDHFSGKQDVRSNEGAFGILTKNLYNRSAAFESAVINATVPFLNTRYYQP